MLIKHTEQRKFNFMLLLLLHCYHDSPCSILVLQKPQLRMSCYVPHPCTKPMQSETKTWRRKPAISELNCDELLFCLSCFLLLSHFTMTSIIFK